ncbi:MAG: hypothetical protein Q9183_003489 [Haloplaca sp. 2 TL-2023]
MTLDFSYSATYQSSTKESTASDSASMKYTTVTYLTDVITGPFTVYSIKAFPGLPESTQMSRAFNEQGVKLRIRKDNRGSARRGKRGASVMPVNGCNPAYHNSSSPLRPENTLPIPRMLWNGPQHDSFPSEPAPKRYRTSMDFGDRMNAAPSYSDRAFGTVLPRPDLFGTYGTSHQLTNAYAPATVSHAPAPTSYVPVTEQVSSPSGASYPVASHQGSSSLGNISNFSHGSQRQDPSNMPSTLAEHYDEAAQFWGPQRWG